MPWRWLYAVCFLDLLGASMIMPALSPYLRSLGMSHVEVGLLGSLYGATQLISGPILGSWSDINGRRSALCLSMIICAGSYGLMGFAISFYSFFIIRFIIGSFKHTQVLCRAFIADIVPRDQQSSVHGLMNAFTAFSFTIGPVVSGHVMEIEKGFQYLTTAAMLIFILNASVVLMFAHTVETSVPVNKIDNTNFFDKIFLVFKELYNIEWSKFWTLFSIKFLFALSGILFFTNVGVILTEHFEILPRYVGYSISFYGFISALCNLGTGKLQTLGLLPKSHYKCLTVMFSVMTITFYLLYLVNNVALFILGLVPLSVSHALSRITLTEVLLEQSDPSCRGSMVGAASSVASFARILAPFVSGVIIAKTSISAPLVVSSFISLIALVLTHLNSKNVYTQNMNDPSMSHSKQK